MQTNFFRQLANLNLTGDLQITLRPTTDNSFVLSILLNNEQCGDEARNLIPPLNLRGTAEELDNGFFESISTPLQTASGLMVDMESFMKSLEEAKKKSAMEKEKTDREKKEKEVKEKKLEQMYLHFGSITKLTKVVKKPKSCIASRIVQNVFTSLPIRDKALRCYNKRYMNV